MMHKSCWFLKIGILVDPWICTLATRCSNNETLNHTQIMWLLISLPLKQGHVELHTQIQLDQKLMNPYVSAKSKLIHVILIIMGYLWISLTHLLFCFCFESRKSFKSINVTLAKKLWLIHKVIFFQSLNFLHAFIKEIKHVFCAFIAWWKPRRTFGEFESKSVKTRDTVEGLHLLENFHKLCRGFQQAMEAWSTCFFNTWLLFSLLTKRKRIYEVCTVNSHNSGTLKPHCSRHFHAS